jgi:hypothetical protein
VNQSAFIGAALLGGFALFLAARGRLTTYADVLWSPSTKGSLPPFPGIPILNVAAAATNDNRPGGGGPGTAVPSAASSGAAANDNWVGDFETWGGEAAGLFGDLADAAALFG